MVLRKGDWRPGPDGPCDLKRGNEEVRRIP